MTEEKPKKKKMGRPKATWAEKRVEVCVTLPIYFLAQASEKKMKVVQFILYLFNEKYGRPYKKHLPKWKAQAMLGGPKRNRHKLTTFKRKQKRRKARHEQGHDSQPDGTGSSTAEHGEEGLRGTDPADQAAGPGRKGPDAAR